jgi:hypothetical protein
VTIPEYCRKTYCSKQTTVAYIQSMQEEAGAGNSIGSTKQNKKQWPEVNGNIKKNMTKPFTVRTTLIAYL